MPLGSKSAFEPRQRGSRACALNPPSALLPLRSLWFFFVPSTEVCTLQVLNKKYFSTIVFQDPDSLHIPISFTHNLQFSLRETVEIVEV